MTPRSAPKRRPARKPKASKSATQRSAAATKRPRKASAARKAVRKPAKAAKRAAKPAPRKAARKRAKPASKPATGTNPAPAKRAAPQPVASEPIAAQRQAAQPLRIALFGASGNIGSRIAQEALARGHRVTALVRHPDRLGSVHPNLSVVRGDATDPLQVAAVGRSHDVVASAIAPPWSELAVLTHAANALVEGGRETGKRVVAVGGAGSLEVAPGKKLLESLDFPQDWRPLAQAHDNALGVFRRKGDGVAWTVVSPSALIEPGQRTGTFRLGADQLLSDRKGNSRISMEDYAVAFVDEIESGANPGRRITVGY